MEPERPFEIHDKRRFHPDEEPSKDAPTAEEPEGNVGPVEEAEPASFDEETASSLPPMDVYSLLGTTVGLLANSAWAWLGLVPNPFSGQMEKDFAQARVAIDTVAFLVGQLESHVGEEERRELQNLVANLRINYVQQVESQTPKG